MPPALVLRLVPVALVAWTVSAAAILLPAAAPSTALVLWGATLSLAAASPWIGASRRSRPRGTRRTLRTTLVIGVLALAAAASAASHVALAQPARAEAADIAVGGRAVEVAAHITGKIERRADGSLSFDARTTGITTGEHTRVISTEIVIRVDPDDVDDVRTLDAGATVTARGTASPSRPGERAVLVVWARDISVLRAPVGASATTADLRQQLVRAVAGLPGDGAGLVPGLAVGDTSAVGAELDAAMKQSSLSHLTAVSGANCALVVGIAFAVASGSGAPRAVRVVVGLAVLSGFVLLVTPEPSVVRAAVMAAIAMLGVLLGRTGAGMGMLSLAVAVLLVVDPWLASSLGFALSAAATASLLLLARPLAVGLERRLPRPLALALAVPLAAQLACGPLLILIEPKIPLYGVVANLLAGPAAPVATVVGLAACLAAPLPVLQSGLAALAWLPASWIAGTASTMSGLPASAVPWLEGWPGAVALTALGAAIVAVIVVSRQSGRTVRGIRAVSVGLIAAVIGLTLGTSALTSVAGRWTLPSEWTVLACDVGQGDAVLLRSAGAVALVDTGPDPEPLRACLARAGIDRIDLLVLTHFDADHVGGLEAVVGRVGTALHGSVPAEDQALIDGLAAGGARVSEASAGLTGSLGDARWRVLWPQPGSRAFPVGNDASVVLDVRGGGIPPTLLLGDLSASPQRAVEASDLLDPPYAILKVAHHGSADQDAGLYRVAEPALALVTVGADNDYGHPRAEILTVLDDVGARIARTDENGIVAVWGAGGAVSLWRERGG